MQTVKMHQVIAAEKTLKRLCRCKAQAVLVLKNNGQVLAVKGTKDGETTLVFRGPGENQKYRDNSIFKHPIKRCCRYFEKSTPRVLAWVSVELLRTEIKKAKTIK